MNVNTGNHMKTFCGNQYFELGTDMRSLEGKTTADRTGKAFSRQSTRISQQSTNLNGATFK
jgi:hypothetical protein